MNHRSLFVLTLGVCALATSTLDAQGKKGKGGEAKSGWVSSLAEGKRQVASSGKPMMIVIRCVP